MEAINFLKISKPTIQKLENGKVRMCSDIYEGDTVHNLYYETDEQYEPYLCYERSDRFRAGVDALCSACWLRYCVRDTYY